ncbi:MAG: ABC transporter permease, partial [Dehalococcoidia bacterium]
MTNRRRGNPFWTVRIAIPIALGALWAHKMRASLTTIGIAIGISAVIILVAIGNGASAFITSSVNSMGTNLVFVRPGAAGDRVVAQPLGSALSLTLEDAQAIADPGLVPFVTAVAPEVATRGQIVAGDQNANTVVEGVDDAFAFVRNYNVAAGDFIGPAEVSARSTVVVLGSAVATQLFPGGDPIGQSVRINRHAFRVIGTLESKGGTGFGNADDLVFIPITTFMTRLASQRSGAGVNLVSAISVQVADSERVTDVEADIAALLRQRHRITDAENDDFTITSTQEALKTLSQVTGALTLFLGSIAGISLLVGGIGVMNTMFVSVTERRR